MLLEQLQLEVLEKNELVYYLKIVERSKITQGGGRIFGSPSVVGSHAKANEFSIQTVLRKPVPKSRSG
jgi:hypothetical protein